MMNRLKPIPVVIAVIAVVLLMIVVIMLRGGADKKAAAPQASSAPKPALTITTAIAQTARLPIKLSANGNISAWQEAVIGSESSGLRLTEVRANVGDSVSAGQVLAVFSADTVQADVAQTRASLMEAEANAADAAANAARARTLQSTGAMSAQQINQYQTAEQTAKARVEAAKAMLQVQQLRMQHTQLRAPDSGIISARSATVGSVVASGTELFRMIRKGRLEWRAEVTSTELGHLKPGTSASVRAANGTQLTGKVRSIAPTVDMQNRAALVYVDLQAAKDSAPAKAGMFATGEFDLGVSEALTLPQQAVVIRDGFSYVFRLEADQRVTQLKVQTGRRLGERVEIVSGLQPDAEVAVSGAGFLNDGDLVRVADKKATPSAINVAPGALRLQVSMALLQAPQVAARVAPAIQTAAVNSPQRTWLRDSVAPQRQAIATANGQFAALSLLAAN